MKLLPTLALLLMAGTAHAQAGFSEMAVISGTMGVGANRLCVGEATRGDLGCPTYAPYVSPTGNIGLGTTNPSVTLTVSGTGFMNMLALKGGAGMAAPSSYQGGHWTASSSAIYYNGGSVGVGTANPVTTLDVNGQIRAYGASYGSELSLARATTGDGISEGANLRLDGTTSAHANVIQNSTGALTFWNYGAGSWQEKMRIASNGNVGIGTNAPAAKLEVVDNGTASGILLNISADDASPWAFNIRNQLADQDWGLFVGSDDSLEFRDRTDSRQVMALQGDGNVRIHGRILNSGIASGSSGYYVCVTNDSNKEFNYGSSCSISDIRLKTNIEYLETASSLQGVLSLQGIRYNWKDNGRGSQKEIGLIAQDVERVFPEAVTNNSSGYKTLNYESLMGPLVESIKALKASNDNLAAENAALQADNASHARDIKELRTELEALKRAIPAPTRH